MTPPMARTLLEYTFFGGRPGARVDDKLSIYDDGSLWYWSLAATLSGSANRVGTFTYSLLSVERSAAQALAATLVALPTTSVVESTSATQVTIAATVGDQSQIHTFTLKDDTPTAAILSQAHQFGLALLRKAESHPLAVAKLVMRPLEDQIVSGSRTTALFIVESIGSQTVTLQFLPESFSVSGESQNGAAFSWAGRTKQTMGLIDSGANLVDGVNVAARMPPQMKATAAFMNALQVGEAGMYSLRGRVEGVIALHYPGAEPDKYPRTAFWLTSEPASLKVN